MHIKTRNVNTAFTELVRGIFNGSISTHVTSSRAGEVAMIEEPIIVTYTHPRERVLFNIARDANPFFHMFEALWMLAGRNDVEPLARYNSQISNIASDDGKTFNGAYGYRWRNYEQATGEMANNSTSPYALYRSIDQLQTIIDHLRANPESRRAVLQMWNVEDDLLKIDETKDVCCNTCVYFSVEDRLFLNMTVCNRSNDLVWGMLGANVVHFSMLQEYVALSLGLGVGSYHQMSNNLHVYTANWEPEKWLDGYDHKMRTAHSPPIISYVDDVKTMVPLVKNQKVFDLEVKKFIDWDGETPTDWVEPFLFFVASPMVRAFKLHKERRYREALQTTELIKSDDWRIAAVNWIVKRKTNWEIKQRQNDDNNTIPAGAD